MSVFLKNGGLAPWVTAVTTVACSASDRQGCNFEYCVWREVSSHSSHDPQEILLAQFSLYVHMVAPHTIESLLVGGKKRCVFLKARVRFEPAITDFPSRQLQPLYQGPRVQ